MKIEQYMHYCTLLAIFVGNAMRHRCTTKDENAFFVRYHLFRAHFQKNTVQVYRLQAGELGSVSAVLYVTGCYGVFSLEELLDMLGSAPRESLLPALAKPSSFD